MNNENKINDYDESTVLDNQVNNTNLNNAQGTANVQSEETKKPRVWKKVAMGTATGLVLGAATGILTSGKPVDSAEETTEETHSNPVVDDDISMATSVNNDMSFSEAFAAARAEVGAGGVFEWHGNLYNTYTANEWDNMTAQERADYGSHFNWAAQEGTNNYMAHNTHHTNDAEVVSHETAQNDANVHATVASSGSEASVVEPSSTHLPEVEVLGVVHDNETGMNIGGMTLDGQEVLLFDVNGDETFDYAAADFNHDGELQQNEVTELPGQNITVEDLGGYIDPMNNQAGAYTTGLENDYLDEDVPVDL